MHCCEFLHHPILNKKGYYFYGSSGTSQYVLRDQFPLAYRVTSHEELASSAPGCIIISPEWAVEALNYVGLPASDRVYLFVPDDNGENNHHDEVMKAFIKAKLPRIDCSNPTTPKTHQVTVDYIQHRTKLSESLARKFAIAMTWDLGHIFNSLSLWYFMINDVRLPESKAINLINVLAPPQIMGDFIDNLLTGTYHRIQPVTYDALDSKEALEQLSERLNELRILMEVYSRQKNVSILVKDSGLDTVKLKYYIPLLNKWTKTRMRKWSDIIVWASSRIENPGSLEATVTLLSRA